MTSYERIYSVFLLKIEDYDFADLSDKDANEMLFLLNRFLVELKKNFMLNQIN